MSASPFQTPPPDASVEMQISGELQYFLTETAEDLEITPDELVRQAVSSYCKMKQGEHHE